MSEWWVVPGYDAASGLGWTDVSWPAGLVVVLTLLFLLPFLTALWAVLHDRWAAHAAEPARPGASPGLWHGGHLASS